MTTNSNEAHNLKQSEFYTANKAVKDANPKP